MLVPVYFFKEDIPSISVIAEKLQLTNTEIIVACLPMLQAKILSDFAIVGQKENSKRFKSLLCSLVAQEVSWYLFVEFHIVPVIRKFYIRRLIGIFLFTNQWWALSTVSVLNSLCSGEVEWPAL